MSVRGIGVTVAGSSASRHDRHDIVLRGSLSSPLRKRSAMRSSARVRPCAIAAAGILVLLSFPAGVPAQTPPAAQCIGLAELHLANTTITAAETVTSGSFRPPGSTNAITDLPPYCRVAGVIAPTPDSEILFEVWMPIERWNGKFAGVGKRWMGRHNLVRSARSSAPARLCHGIDEYRPPGGAGSERRQVRVREAGTAD